jgi:hypothetical protein
MFAVPERSRRARHHSRDIPITVLGDGEMGLAGIRTQTLSFFYRSFRRSQAGRCVIVTKKVKLIVITG